MSEASSYFSFGGIISLRRGQPLNGRLIATKNVSRTGERSQTFTYKSVSYEPLADSLFELPEAVKRLMK